MIFKFLATNVAIMLAMGLFYGLLIHKKPYRLVRWQIGCGILFGLATVVAMANSYVLRPGAIFDCRSVILSVTGMFAGPITALIAAFIASVFRIWQGGVGTVTGILVIFSTASVGIFFYYLRRTRPYLRDPLWMYAFGVLVHAVMLLLMLTFPWDMVAHIYQSIGLPVIFLFPIGTALLGRIFADQEDRQAAEQQLRAANQQLQASEQQLRAANQQLQANEQQLKAANQQLHASESQLKAYNEQLHAAHQKLLISEEHFRLLMEESPSVIELYDLKGLQIAVNKAYEKLWGFPASHTLFQFNVLKSEEVKRTGLIDYIQRAYAGESIVVPEYEYNATGKTEGKGSGRKRWLHTHIYPIRDKTGTVESIVITHEDVTERRQAEAERKIVEEQWSTTFDAINDSVCLLDPEWKVIRHNRATETLLGKSAGEIIGHPCYKIVHGTNVPIPECPILNVQKSKHRESTMLQTGGRWIEVTADPVLNETDQIIAFVHIVTDITKRKKAEQEMERLMRLLESKNEELQSIVYSASHDLRSPLVNINGFSGFLKTHCGQLQQLLHDKAIPETIRNAAESLLRQDIPEDLEFITLSAKKMESLINGLLQVSRIGTTVICPVPLNMNALIGGIIKNAAYRIQETGADVTTDNLPACVADADQINQVFSNLLDNALKYADPSRKPRIHISGQSREGYCVYCVQDNGIGIHPDHQNKVFELFHRLNPHIAADGEGLGLTIVRRILDMHNGKVWIESVPGKGSQFFVSLPNKEKL